MVQDAKAHEAEDKKERELVEKRNKLDGMVLEIEHSLKENKEKIDASLIPAIEEALEHAKTTLKEKANDASALDESYDKLTQNWYKAAEQLYKQAQSSEQGPKEEEKTEGPIDTDAQ